MKGMTMPENHNIPPTTVVTTNSGKDKVMPCNSEACRKGGQYLVIVSLSPFTNVVKESDINSSHNSLHKN